MNDLLKTVIDAHGGLNRWNQLTTVSARLIQGGALWALKGQAAVLDDVVVTASLHEQRVSHRPFGAADRHSSCTPERVAIEDRDAAVAEALDQPRASFAGHPPETPWNTLQLAHFVGTAMGPTWRSRSHSRCPKSRRASSSRGIKPASAGNGCA
jgi:hypothetical protein